MDCNEHNYSGSPAPGIPRSPIPAALRSFLSGAVFLLLLASCGRFGDKENNKKGTRIVSVSKQLTEIIFAVKGDSDLVGVDISSTYPPAAKKITAVGYHRALNAEGIISLNPSVVWNDGNWGPPQVIEQLKKVGIPLRQFDGGNTLDSTKQLIRQVAAEFHNPSAGDSICKKLDADMARVDSVRKTYKDTPRVLIIHFGQAANQYFVLNRKGTPEQMLEWAGAINVADTAQKWKNLSAEVIAKAQPDVILATDFGYDLQGSLEKFKQLPGIALSPAAKNNRIFRIEEHDLVYLGPRTGENVLEIMKLIHHAN
ncbi:MAG TPA: ABC transporter substrate-binding protein [Puia sp.]|nr:ABC transporter substrate-binding protein [Puia sp.]